MNYDTSLVARVIILQLSLAPLVKLTKLILPKNIHQKLSTALIPITDLFFLPEKKQLNTLRAIKYDLRRYRDTYDRLGLELYFKVLDPKTLFHQKVVLDFGCGVGGKCLEILKFHPKKLTGIDLSKRNIAYAQELTDRQNKKILSFRHLDIGLLPSTSKYDTVVSYTVFEHIPKDEIVSILNHFHRLLRPSGHAVIVFNHYQDRYGSHLKEYIYHPWPQLLFDEQDLNLYWNQKLREDKNITPNSYFPVEYLHGFEKSNHDCYMNLNRLSKNDFLTLIKGSKMTCQRLYPYSTPSLPFKPPLFPKECFEGSFVYLLSPKKQNHGKTK